MALPVQFLHNVGVSMPLSSRAPIQVSSYKQSFPLLPLWGVGGAGAAPQTPPPPSLSTIPGSITSMRAYNLLMTMYCAGGHAACAAPQIPPPPSLSTIPGSNTSMHAYND